jgi:hypothetical protein
MKIIIAVFCCALSFSAVADTNPPAPTYTMTTPTTEPTNTINELDTDPEHTATLTTTEETTIDTNLAQNKTYVYKKWQKRLKDAKVRTHK